MKRVKQKSTAKHAQKVKQTSVKQTVKQNTGGSVWESNPPKTLLVPPNGFEVREAHRDLYAPTYYNFKYKLSACRAQ